jgi:hypothetical protein
LLVSVKDGAEVEGKRVLAVINVWPVVHKCLLQPNIAAESVVVSNCPS